MTKTNNSEWRENTGGTWKPEKKEDLIEGLLTDIQHNIGVNNSTMYTVQEKESGENIGVWGSTVLDQRMKGISIGMDVRIVYKGLGEAKGGKQAPKLWAVFFKEPST